MTRFTLVRTVQVIDFESGLKKGEVMRFTEKFSSLRELKNFLIRNYDMPDRMESKLNEAENLEHDQEMKIAELSTCDTYEELFVVASRKDQKSKILKRHYLVTTILFEKREIHLTGCKVEKIISVITKKFENVEEMLKCFNRTVARKLKNDLEMYDAKYMTEGKLVSESHSGTSNYSKVYLQLVDEEI